MREKFSRSNSSRLRRKFVAGNYPILVSSSPFFHQSMVVMQIFEVEVNVALN